MKNWIKFGAVALVLQVAFSAQAQTEDPIEYFTDSKISDTKFSLAALYAPAYASRRLALYEPVADGNELFAMLNEGAGGVYGQRYGMMAYYELRGMFHVGVGFTTQKSGFISKDFAVFDQNAIFQDTIGVFNAKTSYSALNIPIQFIFHTQITDLWALQVIPSYDLTFYNMINRSWVGEGTMYDRGSEESIQYHKGFNGCIGFALGNEFNVSNNLVLSLRAEFRLGLLPINSADVALSEVPYGVGGSVGFRYYL